MSRSSVTHTHALFVAIFPFADEEDLPQSPAERRDGSTTMPMEFEPHARTRHHFHHPHQGRGARPTHGSPTHGHGLARRPPRSLTAPRLVLNSATHGHALHAVPSPSIDGEAASPTTPTTPRASRRTTRTNSLFANQADDAVESSEEQQQHHDASIPSEVLVRTIGAFFEGNDEREEPSSDELEGEEHEKEEHHRTHAGGGVFDTRSLFENADV